MGSQQRVPPCDAAQRVRIVTGSSTGIDSDLARGLGITLVPIRIIVAGQDLRDGLDITAAEVYDKLRAGMAVSTAAPSPGDYLTAFEERRGPILCLTEASQLSAMNGSARIAAQMAGSEQVRILDTGTAAGGLRLLVLAAAGLAARGQSLDVVAEQATRLCERIEMAGLIRRAEFLRRSGRMQTAAWASSLLRVQPVFRFSAGHARLWTFVTSSRQGVAALHRLALTVNHVQGGGSSGERFHCAVFHADGQALAAQLTQRLQRDAPLADLSLCEMTPAMAVHTGPEAIGQACYVEPVAARAATV